MLGFLISSCLMGATPAFLKPFNRFFFVDSNGFAAAR